MMTSHFFMPVALLGLLFIPSFVHAKEPVPVVVTLPVLKDLVEKVGGDYVTVHSLITGIENEHTYTPKPSDVRMIQKARLLVTIGLGLDAWTDSLIQNADRPDLIRITTSAKVPLLFDQGVSPAGKSHPIGNPHIWLDPENVKIMSQHITDGLSRIDSNHQEAYRKNQIDFSHRLDRLTQEMMDQVKGLPAAHRKVIVHHPAWPYFAKRFGFVIAGEIQTMMGTHLGSEPSAKQTEKLVRLIRQEKVGVIISEPQLNPKVPKILSEETGARVIILSPMPGALPGTQTYLDFIRYNVETLVNALQGG
jgi:ABC-type Zn uptake system ZnuABC Zn-binding protein ZnuA